MLLMHPLSASAVMRPIYTEVGDTEDKVVGCGEAGIKQNDEEYSVI